MTRQAARCRLTTNKLPQNMDILQVCGRALKNIANVKTIFDLLLNNVINTCNDHDKWVERFN